MRARTPNEIAPSVLPAAPVRAAAVFATVLPFYGAFRRTDTRTRPDSGCDFA